MHGWLLCVLFPAVSCAHVPKEPLAGQARAPEEDLPAAGGLQGGGRRKPSLRAAAAAGQEAAGQAAEASVRALGGQVGSITCIQGNCFNIDSLSFSFNKGVC